MLVFGDRRRIESVESMLTALRIRLQARPPSAHSGPREWGTSLVIETGELVQGILDALGARKESDLRMLEERLRDLALASARAYFATERELSAQAPPPSVAGRAVERALDHLEQIRLPQQVEIRAPEGYSFYAVDPILYALAARELGGWTRRWVVFGILSIGASLGAVVAAAVGTDQLYFVRPIGPAFRRKIAPHLHLEQALRAHDGEAHYAIVDEGPGLSGSTFGAVADWLQYNGISSGRIHFFPSHGGDVGPHASQPHGARWRRAHRCYRSFESYFDDARLRALLFDGERGEIRDVSAGRWRGELFSTPAAWPPVHPQLERRKYLLCTPKDPRVAKFVGLGSDGEALVERAFRFHRAGFGPQPIAYRRGFLISTWHATATPLSCAFVRRGEWLERATSYLIFLARTCPIETPGASLKELLTMASFNIAKVLGREAGSLVDERWRERLGAIARACAPIAIDARMHAWEWLVLSDGRLLKADALDHHADHGLVGCQDLAWDLAGLRVEHAMNDVEWAELVANVIEAAGYRRQPEKEIFFTCCYCAYQMGHYALAAEVAGIDPADQRRSSNRRDYYAEYLRDLLERDFQP